MNQCNDGAWYLMPRGSSLKSDDLTQSDKLQIIENLHQLHCKGVVHGDPRLPNVVYFTEKGKKKFVWIDVTEPQPPVPTVILEEMRQLLQNLSVSVGFELLQSYSENLNSFDCATFFS